MRITNVYTLPWYFLATWWRHHMETFSALQAICAGNSPVAGEFPTQRPVTQRFGVFFDLRVNKRRIYSKPLSTSVMNHHYSWWRHQMETFSTLLALCAGNSPAILTSMLCTWTILNGKQLHVYILWIIILFWTKYCRVFGLSSLPNI